MERGRIQGLSKFFEYPLLSQERVKLLWSRPTCWRYINKSIIIIIIIIQIWRVYLQSLSE